MARLFRWLPQARWKRWLIFAAVAGVLFVMLLVTVAVSAFLLWRNPRVQEWVMVKVLSHQARQPAEFPSKPQLSEPEARLLRTNMTEVRTAAELFQPTNIWDVQVKFSSNQWVTLGPKMVPPVLHFMQPDGSVLLRNPKALRNGLAGVFGLDFPWSEAELQFGDIAFHQVGARFKGNGTFVGSQRSFKRPYKIDLHKHVKNQQLAGRTILNFHNLTADASCLSDTLAYEFFRQAGVPSPRTAFARLRLTVEGQLQDALLGLYVMVENPDEAWADEQFGIDGVALFKPVTYDLFKDLGDDWQSYEKIYDPKTKIKPKQYRRLIALAKLVTQATDDDFARQVPQFIDVDEFVRFLACEAMLSNYDGILSNGQNFLLFLDPRTERFGLVPWDLDQCWGEFPLVGTLYQREHASVWHPWVGQNRFLERMLGAPEVRERYRRALEDLRANLFLPDRLSHRLEELASIIRPFVKEESGRRLNRFDRQVAPRQPDNGDLAKPKEGQRSFNLNQFFVARAAAVTEQLEGKSEGVILPRRPLR